MRRVLALTAVAAIVVASCAADTTDAAGETLPINDQDNVSSSVDTSTPIDPGDGIGDGTEGSDLPVISPDLADEVEIAVTDLGERLGTGTVIEVVAAHELTWPDGSLGCPEPGCHVHAGPRRRLPHRVDDRGRHVRVPRSRWSASVSLRRNLISPWPTGRPQRRAGIDGGAAVRGSGTSVATAGGRAVRLPWPI